MITAIIYLCVSFICLHISLLRVKNTQPYIIISVGIVIIAVAELMGIFFKEPEAFTYLDNLVKVIGVLIVLYGYLRVQKIFRFTSAKKSAKNNLTFR